MQRKRPSRTPRRNTGSTRRSGRSGRPAWLKAFFATLLLLCIAAGAWWYFQGRQSTAPDDTKLQHIDTVREKGNDADYTDAATEIQDKNGKSRGAVQAARSSGRQNSSK